MDKHRDEDEDKRADTNYCRKHPAVRIPPLCRMTSNETIDHILCCNCR